MHTPSECSGRPRKKKTMKELKPSPSSIVGRHNQPRLLKQTTTAAAVMVAASAKKRLIVLV